MTNRIAIFLGLCILALISLDAWLNDAQGLLFLGKKFFDLLDWMAFWR